MATIAYFALHYVKKTFVLVISRALKWANKKGTRVSKKMAI